MKFHRTTPLTWLLACVMLMTSGLGSSLLAATAKDKANDKSAPTKPSGCATRQFRTMALTTHDPIERETAVLAWLKANGSACTLPQIQYIAGNSPQWLGTADTVRVNGIFDELLDAKSVDLQGFPSAHLPRNNDGRRIPRRRLALNDCLPIRLEINVYVLKLNAAFRRNAVYCELAAWHNWPLKAVLTANKQ